MKKLSLFVLTLYASITIAQPGRRDERFARCVAKGGLKEVQLGKVASGKAQNADVRSGAQKMVDDHSGTHAELKALASKKNIEVPALLSDREQKKIDRLSARTGKDFDKKYARCMVREHREVLREFKREAKSGKDDEMREWATAQIPTLEHHLEMWKDVVKNMDKEGSYSN